MQAVAEGKLRGVGFGRAERRLDAEWLLGARRFTKRPR